MLSKRGFHSPTVTLDHETMPIYFPVTNYTIVLTGTTNRPNKSEQQMFVTEVNSQKIIVTVQKY